MAKSFTKLYSRLVISGVALLLGLVVLAGGIVLIGKASGGLQTDVRFEVLPVAGDGTNEDETWTFLPMLKGYDSAPYVQWTIIHDGPSTNPIIAPRIYFSGGDSDKFILARCCIGSNHVHTDQAERDEIAADQYVDVAPGAQIALPDLATIGNTCFFTVRPKLELAQGTYTTRMIFAASNTGNNTMAEPVLLSFTVFSRAITLTTPTTFTSAPVGYASPYEPKKVTIRNTGNSEQVGDLNVSVNNADFVLSTTATYTTSRYLFVMSESIGSSSYDFYIMPARDMPYGTYTATITVESAFSPAWVETQSFNVSFTVYGTPEPELSPESVDFGTEIAGYSADDITETVTLINKIEATAGTGEFRILPFPSSSVFKLVDYGSKYPISNNSAGVTFDNLAVGERMSITIGLKDGFNDIRSYTGTLGVEFLALNKVLHTDLSFRVTEAPTHGISLTPTGTENVFASIGYNADMRGIAAAVTSIGNQETGVLTVSLSGENSDVFALSSERFIPSSTQFASIPATNDTREFIVKPVPYLAAGRYSATVTVSGGLVESKSFEIVFNVTEKSITLNPSEEMEFYPTSIHNRGEPPKAKTATVTNDGNQPTGELTVTLTGTHAQSFELSENHLISLVSKGDTVEFTVRPKANLNEDTHFATVEVSGDGIETKKFYVRFVVFVCCDCGLAATQQPANNSGNTWLLGLLCMLAAATLATLLYKTYKPAPAVNAAAPVDRGKAAAVSQRTQFGGEITPSALNPQTRPQTVPPLENTSTSSQTPPRPMPATSQLPPIKPVSSAVSTAQTPPVRITQTPPVSSAQQPPSGQQPPARPSAPRQ